jgi:multimeric flavodoxin WrbA
MKITGINCSPRKGQTTQKDLGICLNTARNESNIINTGIIELAGLDIAFGEML